MNCWAVFQAFIISGYVASAAMAAIHTDKPVQETTPVASKPQVCTTYVPLMALKTIKEGKVHYYLIVIPRTEPCH